MPEWEDEHHGVVWSYEEPHLECWVTDNPTVAELIDVNGEVLIRILEREEIGFRLRE